MLRRFLLLVPFILLALTSLFIVGCGGSGSGSSTSGTPSITFVSPPTSVAVSQTAIFTVVEQNSSDPIVWSVVGGSANGSITSDGTYTAPATAGSYQVKAALQHKPTVFASATIAVGGAVSLTLSLPEANPVVIPQSKLTFSANVMYTSNQLVTWTVNGSPINIGSDGTFTAPATGTYTITARSSADPTKTATQQVTVVPNANVRFTFAGKGDVVTTLNPTAAPLTSANLVTLVNKGFYNGIVVHRWVQDFVVQWGDPLTKTLPITDPSIGSGGPGYTIPFEANSLKNVKDSLAMARSSDLNSGGSQVYINLVDNTSLDGSYCVFGAVVSGQSIVDALRVGDTITTATTEAATP